MPCMTDGCSWRGKPLKTQGHRGGDRERLITTSTTGQHHEHPNALGNHRWTTIITRAPWHASGLRASRVAGQALAPSTSPADMNTKSPGQGGLGNKGEGVSAGVRAHVTTPSPTMETTM